MWVRVSITTIIQSFHLPRQTDVQQRNSRYQVSCLSIFLNENISKKKSTSMCCYPLKFYSFCSTRINNRSFILSFRPFMMFNATFNNISVISGQSVLFNWLIVTQSLVLCVCFVDRCLSFCPLYFGHYFVCFSLIYRFWLPLWYLQILLIIAV